MSICSRVINTLWWAFGGKGKTVTLITLCSFVCNWQVTLAFMFAALHVHHLRCLHMGNLKGELLWCQSFCPIYVFFFVCYHSLCSITFSTYVITCQASMFCVLLTHTLYKHFFYSLTGNYKVMTAAPNGTIFRARQNLKPPLKITLWSRFINSQLCEKWQNTTMQLWNAPRKLLMFQHKMCSPLTLLCCQHFYWFYILGQLHAPKL